MLSRRRVIQTGLGTFASLYTGNSLGAFAQGKAPIKVRYNEVVRSPMFGPAYAAITKGFFRDAGLDVTLVTGQGGDKSAAALISNSADIGLIGPEAAIYVLNSASTTKLRIFCGLTSTDGFMLLGREKVDNFDWKMLKDKEILGFRAGSTPILFFNEALRMNGLDPLRDVKLNNNVAIPARVGSWLAGQNQYAIFNEPEASQIQLDGKGYILASVGHTVGYADYTSFMATDDYIKQNPDVLHRWTNAIYRAQKWTEAASIDEIVDAIQNFFPSINRKALMEAADLYRGLKVWKPSPVVEESAINRFQNILENGHVLEPGKRVKFADLVLPNFASDTVNDTAKAN
jgi:NitT/TauT family transport system substrate-binding protein